MFSFKNYVNCLFFSNEKIPLFIEKDDRRLNVIETGQPLINHSWFSADSDNFVNGLSDEVLSFARFLVNWKYDADAATTCINNELKVTIISVGMDRFEEFATHLKANNYEWFQDNLSTEYDSVTVNSWDVNGKIKKRLALALFNLIYPSQSTSEVVLGKKLKLYDIQTIKTKDDANGHRQYYYAWENNVRVVQDNSEIVQDEQSS